MQLLQEVRRSMETEYSQLTAIHADKEEELGHLKCKHALKENECALLQEELSSKNEHCSYSNRGCQLVHRRPPSQLLDCRSEPNVGEKKKECDDSCNIGGKATAATERGVAILDLIGNAEMAGMMDELRADLEMERAKCRGL